MSIDASRICEIEMFWKHCNVNELCLLKYKNYDNFIKKLVDEKRKNTNWTSLQVNI